jgi:hypothetical protein
MGRRSGTSPWPPLAIEETAQGIIPSLRRNPGLNESQRSALKFAVEAHSCKCHPAVARVLERKGLVTARRAMSGGTQIQPTRAGAEVVAAMVGDRRDSSSRRPGWRVAETLEMTTEGSR